MATTHLTPYLLASALMLAGCASMDSQNAKLTENPYPVIQRIRLEHPLPVPSGEASVRLQQGRIVARNGVEETEPYCILEINTVSEGHLTIQAGPILITRTQHRVETFSGMPVLALPLFSGLSGRNDGPSQIYYITSYSLQSARQPDVRSLTCQHNQAAAGSTNPRHLTRPEMQQAVGGFIRFENGAMAETK